MNQRPILPCLRTLDLSVMVITSTKSSPHLAPHRFYSMSTRTSPRPRRRHQHLYITFRISSFLRRRRLPSLPSLPVLFRHRPRPPRSQKSSGQKSSGRNWPCQTQRPARTSWPTSSPHSGSSRTKWNPASANRAFRTARCSWPNLSGQSGRASSRGSAAGALPSSSAWTAATRLTD